MFGNRRYHWILPALASALIGCAGPVDHDELLAGKTAEEFARIALVKRDVEKGYALLSDSTRGYVSLEQFKEVLARLHPGAFPTTVAASEYEPMKGEKAIYIFMTGEGPGEQFYYRITMEGTAATGYRVLRLDRAGGPYPPPNTRRQFGKSPGARP